MGVRVQKYRLKFQSILNAVVGVKCCHILRSYRIFEKFLVANRKSKAYFPLLQVITRSLLHKIFCGVFAKVRVTPWQFNQDVLRKLAHQTSSTQIYSFLKAFSPWSNVRNQLKFLPN